jgi:hypothetical protein
MTTYEKWCFSSEYSLPSYYWVTSYTLRQFYSRENSELCTLLFSHRKQFMQTRQRQRQTVPNPHQFCFAFVSNDSHPRALLTRQGNLCIALKFPSWGITDHVRKCKHSVTFPILCHCRLDKEMYIQRHSSDTLASLLLLKFKFINNNF